MPANSNNLLTAQTHPGDSSTQIITGDKIRGDGFYGRSDGLHTIQLSTNNYTGSIKIQATLAVSPIDSDFFTVFESDYVEQTVSVIENFTGNYVWIRAVLDNFTDGTVEYIIMNH